MEQPPIVAEPDPASTAARSAATRPSLEAARAQCHALTRTHYENFPVARLVPAEVRPHVSAIYAFARTADDLADEGWGEPGAPTPAERVATLRAYEAELDRALAGEPLTRPEWAWIFVAVADTVRACEIPSALLRDLLDAFRQDCVQLSYETFDELLAYARRSANPIGRLVLLVHGHREPSWLAWSDALCTALQLANFWQDVGVDVRKAGRIYVPRDAWRAHGVERADFAQPTASPALRACLRSLLGQTQALFDEGQPLLAALPMPLRAEIKLTWLGGQRILEKIEAQDCDTLARRPKLTKWDGAQLLVRALLP